MSVDENLVDHIPSWGTTWGTHEKIGEHHKQLSRTLWEHDGNHFLGCTMFLGGTGLVGAMQYPTRASWVHQEI